MPRPGRQQVCEKSRTRRRDLLSLASILNACLWFSLCLFWCRFSGGFLSCCSCLLWAFRVPWGVPFVHVRQSVHFDRRMWAISLEIQQNVSAGFPGVGASQGLLKTRKTASGKQMFLWVWRTFAKTLSFPLLVSSWCTRCCTLCDLGKAADVELINTCSSGATG